MQDEFPELKTALFWFRVLLALTAGIVMGVTGATGSLGFGAGAGAIIALPIAWYTAFLEVDVEDYGSQELLMEGAMPGIAVFVLLWTALFNALHL